MPAFCFGRDGDQPSRPNFCTGASPSQEHTATQIASVVRPRQAAGAAPTLRYGPAGDSAPRLRLKAAGMAERFPFGPSKRAEFPGLWCDAIERYQMRYKITG